MKNLVDRAVEEGVITFTLLDPLNCSYPTKAEFINCFIIHSKYFKHLKEKIGVKRS